MPRHSRILLGAATASYAANCALGASVATRVLDTTRYRWVHHALYIATAGLTLGATAALAWHAHPSARPLSGAAVPLAVIPYAGRGRRHTRIALAAAPFYAAALIAAAIADRRP